MLSIKLGPNSKIKEDDLIQALEQNQIMGYGTDIVDQQSS
jgi:lactate dehydrogenase-like 2-hydroxyacid dehydrogenase